MAEASEEGLGSKWAVVPMIVVVVVVCSKDVVRSTASSPAVKKIISVFKVPFELHTKHTTLQRERKG